MKGRRRSSAAMAMPSGRPFLLGGVADLPFEDIVGDVAPLGRLASAFPWPIETLSTNIMAVILRMIAFP